jgi:hypothetical protein
MDVTYLTGGVDIRGGLAVTPTTTPTSIAPVFIIATTRAIIIISAPLITTTITAALIITMVAVVAAIAGILRD